MPTDSTDESSTSAESAGASAAVRTLSILKRLAVAFDQVAKAVANSSNRSIMGFMKAFYHALRTQYESWGAAEAEHEDRSNDSRQSDHGDRSRQQ